MDKIFRSWLPLQINHQKNHKRSKIHIHSSSLFPQKVPPVASPVDPGWSGQVDHPQAHVGGRLRRRLRSHPGGDAHRDAEDPGHGRRAPRDQELHGVLRCRGEDPQKRRASWVVHGFLDWNMGGKRFSSLSSLVWCDGALHQLHLSAVWALNQRFKASQCHEGRLNPPKRVDWAAL